jgi:hypothetical protein
MVLASGMVSLIVGLDIWFGTLQTRANLNVAWSELPQASQSQLQQAVCISFPWITNTR